MCASGCVQYTICWYIDEPDIALYNLTLSITITTTSCLINMLELDCLNPRSAGGKEAHEVAASNETRSFKR